MFMPRIGRYELLRQLGRGGMAEVFLARRRGPGGVEKQLAIKRIRPERTGDPRFVEMFVTEARLSMAMAHRNVVQVFDFGRVGDELFLVMEYVEGVDLGTALRALVDREQAMDPLLAAVIAMEACQALDYAHHLGGSEPLDEHRASPRDGVVHRDVTPRNILLSVAGEIKLVDFGVATTVTDLGAAGRVRGTPAYMSPEQARGEVVDGRSDVFSLGLVLWESLAGQRVYGTGEPREMLEKARQGQVPSLSDEAPEALRAIVAKATAEDREMRFASARAMQLELDAFVLSARAAAESQPPSHRIAAWIREITSQRRLAGIGELALPAGDVVTFLDNGADGLASSLGCSTAATVAEDTGVESMAELSGEAELDREHKGGASRRRWLAGGIALALAAGLALWGVQMRSSPESDTAQLQSNGPVANEVSDEVAATAPAVPEALSPLEDGAEGTSEAAEATESEPGAEPVAADPQPEAEKQISGANRRAPEGRASARQAPRPRAKAAATALGTVKISATPWARVRVQGQKAGCDETPCVLQLPAGSHSIRLVNPVADLRKTLSVQVKSGETVVINTSLGTP